MPNRSSDSTASVAPSQPRGLLVAQHVFNITGVAAGFTILLIASPYEPLPSALAVGLGLLVCLALYARFHHNENLRLSATSLVLALACYAIVAENILSVQNAFHLNIAQKLDLSARLLRKASTTLTADGVRKSSFEQYGLDRLFFRYVPGSACSLTYDRGLGGHAEYTMRADETGYLNQNTGAYDRAKAIDLFVAGGSVLQGVGMPSCLEAVKKRSQSSLWNLSIGSYASRQKAEALRSFALPKSPRAIVLEFSSSDASLAHEDATLEAAGGSFESRFDIPALLEMLLARPGYREMMQESGASRPLASLRRDNLTLALSSAILNWIKVRLDLATGGPAGQSTADLYVIARPAYAHFSIRREAYPKWVSLGLNSVFSTYERLIDTARECDKSLRIAVMYNPSSYEVHRNAGIPADPFWDSISNSQRTALKAFCETHAVEFIDLTPAFQRHVAKDPRWLYGKQDLIHWSELGTAVAADIIFKEFSERGLLQAR